MGKIRKILFKADGRDVFSKIIRDLKTNSFFDFGRYERCYPDNPQSITKGYFQMEIKQQHESRFVFQIESVEGNSRINTNYLDYYEIFETEKALWFYVKEFFSEYNDVEKLSQAVYRKFGFLHPKEGALLFTHYSLLKDDLPDGDTFEDFLEEFKDFRLR